MFDLTDKVAVVTGGSSGIGFTLASILIQEGARVAIVNRNRKAGELAADRLRKKGGETWTFSADVSNKHEVEIMAINVEKMIGPVDILVNSAGINIRKSAFAFTQEEWQQILGINLTGTFWTCQTIGQKMVNRGKGRIINISSIGASIGLIDRAPYCASKGGVTQLTKALAIEWAPFGVTVNAIGPGFVETPLIKELMTKDGFEDKIKTLVPMQRIGQTIDLKGIFLVLCSEAGAYITGQTIYVDGGQSIW